MKRNWKPPTKIKYNNGRVAVDLTVSWDRWTDPGDYPSNMGAGPLPPGPWYPEDIHGTVTLTLDIKDRWELVEYDTIEDWVNDGEIGDLGLEGVKIHWKVLNSDANTITVYVDEFETID